MCYCYARDEDIIREWAESSQTEEGAKAFLEKYVYSVRNHQEYLEKIGWERLEKLREKAEKRR